MTPSMQSIALCQRLLNVECDQRLIVDGKMGGYTENALGSSTVKGILSMYASVDLTNGGDPNWRELAEKLGISLAYYVGEPRSFVNGVKGDFVPEGIILHHTGGPEGREHAPFDIFASGRADLSGPLCNFTTSRDGSAECITNGRSHHAGKGDSDVLSRIQSGMTPDVSLPVGDDMHGNTHFYGIEADHSGSASEGIPITQNVLNMRLAAMWCMAWRWDPMVVCIGHKEWTRRKVDPVFWPDMNDYRHGVRVQVAEWKADPPARPLPSTKHSFECPHCGSDLFVNVERAND